MGIQNKIFYNESSASKLGWEPSWFGEDEFNEELIEKISEFQAKYDLDSDGLCGPMTYRRMVTEREASATLAEHQLSKFMDDDGNYIICDDKRVVIGWDKVVKGHGIRPVLTDVRVHGAKIKECLGFYPVQIEAYKALVKALCAHYDIPMECPLDDEGKMLRKVHKPSSKAKYKGVVNHFHLTRGKIDVANLELDRVLEEARNEAD